MEYKVDLELEMTALLDHQIGYQAIFEDVSDFVRLDLNWKVLILFF